LLIRVFVTNLCHGTLGLIDTHAGERGMCGGGGGGGPNFSYLVFLPSVRGGERGGGGEGGGEGERESERQRQKRRRESE